MTDFIVKLQTSGYGVSTVDGIIVSGLKCYFRKLSIDLEGGQPVNMRDDTNEMQKRRHKLGANQSWYNRRRGGDPGAKDSGWRCDPVTETGPRGCRWAEGGLGNKDGQNPESEEAQLILFKKYLHMRSFGLTNKSYKKSVFKLQNSYAPKNKPQLTLEAILACQTCLACTLMH